MVGYGWLWLVMVGWVVGLLYGDQLWVAGQLWLVNPYGQLYLVAVNQVSIKIINQVMAMVSYLADEC